MSDIQINWVVIAGLLVMYFCFSLKKETIHFSATRGIKIVILGLALIVDLTELIGEQKIYNLIALLITFFVLEMIDTFSELSEYPRIKNKEKENEERIKELEKKVDQIKKNKI